MQTDTLQNDLKNYRTRRQSQGIANSTINTEMSVAGPKVFQYTIDNGIITRIFHAEASKCRPSASC